MANPLDPHEQNRRALYLYGLYRRDGRHNPDHPMHGLYTGLYMARIRYLVEQDMRELLAQNLPECHPARGQVTVI